MITIITHDPGNEDLLSEKKALQKALRRFEVEFQNSHGHPPKVWDPSVVVSVILIQTNTERGPMMVEYRRYKVRVG